MTVPVSYDTTHFYRSLIDLSSDIIFLLGPDGCILYASAPASSMLGRPPDHLVGKCLAAILHPQDALFFQQELNLHGAGDLARLPIFCRMQNHQGEWRAFEGFARSLPELGVAVYLHDVTDRRRAEETLQNSVADLARSNAFIAALSQVAERIATTTNPDQVMETLGSELQRIGLTCAVSLLEPESTSFTLHYISIKPSILAQVERKTGLALSNYRIPLNPATLVASGKQAEFHPDLLPYLTEIISQVPECQVMRAVRLTGISPFTPLISLPLKVRERLLGSLAVWGPGLHEGDIQALSVFANQVAGTIDKAILLDTVQRRVQETETLREAAAVVTSALDLDQVLDRILTQLERVIRYDSAAVFLREEERLIVTACRGSGDPGLMIGQAFPVEGVHFQEIVGAHHSLTLDDVQANPKFQGLFNPATTRGWMGIPLVVRGASIGLLTLESQQPGAYGPENETVARSFANQAAIAIENARLFKQVQHLAITDSLTGLYNRRHFFELASREFERSHRYGRVLSLLMWDIDLFKRVNDSYGHLVGDRVLQAVTRRCQEHLREVDILGRYGGEEFVALLPETDLERALGAADRLCQAISKTPIVSSEVSVHLSISVGVAELDEDCSSLEALLDRADKALYLAKQAGRNCVAAWRKP